MMRWKMDMATVGKGECGVGSAVCWLLVELVEGGGFVAEQDGNLVDDRVHQVAVGAHEAAVDLVADFAASLVEELAGADAGVELGHQGRVSRRERGLILRAAE